jgi:hypothetical protein
MTLSELQQEEFGIRFSADHSAPVSFISEPAIIFNIFGQILVWNLPGAVRATLSGDLNHSSEGKSRDIY